MITPLHIAPTARRADTVERMTNPDETAAVTVAAARTPAPPTPTATAPSGWPQVRRPVPVRTILATIGLALLTFVLLAGAWQVRRILTWIVVAAFFAVTLSPVAGWFERHVTRGRRSLATLIVFVLGFVVVA